MTSPQQARNIRLKNDFDSMQNIQGNIVRWEAIRGNVPYVESYRLTVNIRSIISDSPQYRDYHEIMVELPADYPRNPPQIRMISDPVVFHPNWFPDKRWCYGTWMISEGLGQHVIRMLRTLQYDLEITNEQSPANSSAKDFYLNKRSSGLFPCDRQVLPDPTKKKTFTVHEVKKFDIH